MLSKRDLRDLRALDWCSLIMLGCRRVPYRRALAGTVPYCRLLLSCVVSGVSTFFEHRYNTTHCSYVVKIQQHEVSISELPLCKVLFSREREGLTFFLQTII
jgi:hypothetical protein